MVLGYSLSSSTLKPSLAWAGRLRTDTAGTMGQGEAVVQTGGGVETGNFISGQTADRWGDYSNMSVDPADDCTFWYTNELYPADGIFNWDTRIASVKLPNCGANDFSISADPVTVMPGSSGATTIKTTLTKGSAESLALNLNDLPAGVTGSFSPSPVTAGSNSTLTLNVAPSVPIGSYPLTVIATGASAYHGATVMLTVSNTATHTLTVAKGGTGTGNVTSSPPGIDCGATCNAQFGEGSTVTLTASPSAHSAFTGWSGGGCSGTGACTVTLNGATKVTATFARGSH
jgi:hypothetical protein